MSVQCVYETENYSYSAIISGGTLSFLNHETHTATRTVFTHSQTVMGILPFAMKSFKV